MKTTIPLLAISLLAPATAFAASPRGAEVDRVEISHRVVSAKSPAATVPSLRKTEAKLPKRSRADARKHAIDRTMKMYSPGLKLCSRVSQFIRRDASKEVSIRFTAGRDGRARNIRVTDRGRVTPIERCMALKVSEWVLPRGNSVTVNYKIKL